MGVLVIDDLEQKLKDTKPYSEEEWEAWGGKLEEREEKLEE